MVHLTIYYSPLIKGKVCLIRLMVGRGGEGGGDTVYGTLNNSVAHDMVIISTDADRCDVAPLRNFTTFVLFADSGIT